MVSGRVGETRATALGFQEHPYWHLGAPAMHRNTEYAEIYAFGLQVCGDRNAVGPGADYANRYTG
jgi:hypothetical protein